MRRQAGVTLLELLIAVSLVSLISIGILWAMRVGLGAMERSAARMQANRRVMGAQRVLEQQIAGFIPVPAECMQGPNTPAVKIGFFQGEPQAMRFVSSYSIQEAARGYPRILEFSVIPAENNEGVRLIVNEHLYTGPASAGAFCLGPAPDPLSGVPVPRFAPIQPGPRSFVLADKLAFCRFLYREPMPPPMPPRWTGRWTIPEMPLAIRVEMAPFQADPSRLHVMPVTQVVHVTRDPMLRYEE